MYTGKGNSDRLYQATVWLARNTQRLIDTPLTASEVVKLLKREAKIQVSLAWVRTNADRIGFPLVTRRMLDPMPRRRQPKLAVYDAGFVEYTSELERLFLLLGVPEHELETLKTMRGGQKASEQT